MNTKTPDEILCDICFGRADLLALGQRFNQDAQKHTEDDGLSNLNSTVEAIFELEEMPLSPEEKQLVRQLDQLKWSDGQAIEFLKAMGSSK